MDETLSHRPILIQLDQDLIKDNRDRKQEEQIKQIKFWLDNAIFYPVKTDRLDGDMLAIHVYDSFRSKTIDMLNAIQKKIHNWKVVSINNDSELF